MSAAPAPRPLTDAEGMALDVAIAYARSITLDVIAMNVSAASVTARRSELVTLDRLASACLTGRLHITEETP